MNIKNNLKKLIFYRQHPEAALRYLPIVSLLKKQRLDKAKILEVGSGSYGITPYLKRKITGVDTNFSEPDYPLLRQVQGSADKVPFKAKKFEVVILSDVLEHLPPKIRELAINEAIRVSSKVVIISGPFGKDAAKQDQELADYSIKKTGTMHPFFKEHLEHGLPEVEEIIKIIKKNKRTLDVKVVGEYLSLKSRLGLMKFFITNNKLQYYFYLKGLMPLVPIFTKLNQKPCYRKIVYIKLNHD